MCCYYILFNRTYILHLSPKCIDYSSRKWTQTYLFACWDFDSFLFQLQLLGLHQMAALKRFLDRQQQFCHVPCGAQE